MQERNDVKSISDIESMLTGADFSKETDLKGRLREKLGIAPVKETSYKDLEQKLSAKRDSIHRASRADSKVNNKEMTEDKVKSFGGMKR